MPTACWQVKTTLQNLFRTSPFCVCKNPTVCVHPSPHTGSSFSVPLNPMCMGLTRCSVCTFRNFLFLKRSGKTLMNPRMGSGEEDCRGRGGNCPSHSELLYHLCYNKRTVALY